MDNEKELNIESEIDEAVDIITLTDDEGKEHEFEIVDNAEFDGKEYVALVPVFGDGEDMLQDSGELVVLKVVVIDGEDFLESIEDEAEFDKIGGLFMERLSEFFDFEE